MSYKVSFLTYENNVGQGYQPAVLDESGEGWVLCHARGREVLAYAGVWVEKGKDTDRRPYLYRTRWGAKRRGRKMARLKNRGEWRLVEATQ